jgi:hypothetical protein
MTVVVYNYVFQFKEVFSSYISRYQILECLFLLSGFLVPSVLGITIILKSETVFLLGEGHIPDLLSDVNE